jgi:hypothetical protein
MARIINLIVVFVLISNYVLSQSTLNKADQAMLTVDIYSAEKLYNDVFSDSLSDSQDRIMAANKLIYLTGKFKNDINKAKEISESAFRLKKGESAIYLQLASVCIENRSYDSAFYFASKGLTEARSYYDSLDASLLFAKIVLLNSMEKIDNKVDVDYDLIQRSIFIIRYFEKENVDNFDLNYIKIGLSLIAKQGDEALNAWKQYFLINDSIPAYLKNAYSELYSVLHTMNTRTTSPDVNTLVLGLAHSRMYDYALMVYNIFLLNGSGKVNSEAKDILHYGKFLAESRNITYAYYNQVILDKGREAEYNKIYKLKIENLKKAIWDSLCWKKSKPSFSSEKFKKEMDIRFGLKLISDRTNGFISMCTSHAVDQDFINVEQYGRTCKFNLFIVDKLYSNDLLGYFLDIPTVGGWAKKNEVVQVRQKNLKFIADIYKIFADSIKYRGYISSIDKQIETDYAAAVLNPICDLPGICSKMMFNAIGFVYDSLKRQSNDNIQLKMNFINTMNRMTIGSIIIAHEGRHKLDYKYKPWLKRKPYKLEYNAKLSEIVFSAYPFLMLSKIMVYNPDATDPHGKASAMITAGLYRWMELHKQEIKNFNYRQPTLPQITLLSDAQLIYALRSLDPWGKDNIRNLQSSDH